jgi:PhnB protein
MNMPFKPRGYNSVSPYFVVKDAQRFIDLMTQIFNAIELRRYDTPGGLIMHAELRLDDSVIMVSDATEKFPANQHMMHVYVANVDDTFKTALDNGCEKLEEPTEKPGDPDRRGMFMDFAGNGWAVGTQLNEAEKS